MRAGLTRLESWAFMEEGIELVLPLPVKRGGHVATVVQPSPTHDGEFARFRRMVGSLFRDAMFIAESVEWNECTRQPFALRLFRRLPG